MGLLYDMPHAVTVVSCPAKHTIDEEYIQKGKPVKEVPSTPNISRDGTNYCDLESSTTSSDSDNSSWGASPLHVSTALREKETLEEGKRQSILKSSSDETCSENLTKKQVTFGAIEFRKYPIILGDHPDCSIGPPVCLRIKDIYSLVYRARYTNVAHKILSFLYNVKITIGWEYQKESTVVSVEYWETNRLPRRHDENLLTSMKHRMSLLRNVATPEEMKEAILEVRKVQKQRVLSYDKSQCMLVDPYTRGQTRRGICFNIFEFCFLSGGGRPSAPSSLRQQRNQLLFIPTQGNNGAVSFACS